VNGELANILILNDDLGYQLFTYSLIHHSRLITQSPGRVGSIKKTSSIRGLLVFKVHPLLATLGVGNYFVEIVPP
jgi:hypothetical protein